MMEFNTAKREPIKIDGKKYFLIDASDLDLKDYLWLRQQGSKVMKIQDGVNTETEVEELTKTIDGVCARILKAPDKVRGKLSDMQKLRIIGFFLKRVMTPVQSSIAEPQPGSNVSTEGTLSGG